MTPEQHRRSPQHRRREPSRKISVGGSPLLSVQYEDGEERPASALPAAEPEESLWKRPRKPSSPKRLDLEKQQGANDLSTEDIADAEENLSASDAISEADAREQQIEMNNDAVDSLVNESQETSDEGIDNEGNDRG